MSTVRAIRVGAAQVPQVADLGINLKVALEYMDRAAEAGVELLCFPETHLPGYRVGITPPEDPCDPALLEVALAEVRIRCRELGLGVVMGTETPNPGGKPSNSAVVVGDDGEVLATHHKSRLTPKDAEAYAPGREPGVFSWKGIPMGVVICFEAFRFPEVTRGLARAGAEVVFHPQFNHVLPGMEWKTPVHEALLVARAAENTLYLVSANMAHQRNNCRSLIIAPDGLVAAAWELTREMLVTADLDLDRATHAFVSRGDPAAQIEMLGES